MAANISDTFKSAWGDIGIDTDTDSEARNSSIPIKELSTSVVELEKLSMLSEKGKRTKIVAKKRLMGSLEPSRSKRKSLRSVLEDSTRYDQGNSMNLVLGSSVNTNKNIKKNHKEKWNSLSSCLEIEKTRRDSSTLSQGKGQLIEFCL